MPFVLAAAVMFVIVVFILSVLLVTGLLPSIMGNIVNVLGDIWKNIGGR